eukprot:TRINITY_DN8759_c0_g1_i3.p1 TRINITY_DN8759_c0_g1~~TRINITY_DN8759_c0_g1_i3.p1  ORF type:complete len:1563 (+),score=375.08 TRINITY_DN8759_c0_g1_i3:326-5014(+)
MFSSTLMGDRKWVSGRRSMHVLGKAAVPKPINLPSQRLENQGLDPNVEIVPKGTHSWGNHSSSSAQNAWGSLALLPPTTDTSVGSSSPLTARPSSGGSVTRPSTAGSERSHEHVSGAWGPNSRPSSASGTLATNQAQVVSTRPRSAETRSGSSQLSRFAEPVAETSEACGGPTMAVNLGTASTKHNEFTLSSRDFPTLGSETNSELHARRGHSSHGRPVSSGGAAARQERSTPTDDGPIDASAGKGDVNTWRRETSPKTGGGTPRMEKWQRDPQQSQPFPTVNIPSHHFDPWHDTPFRRSPDGVWYRGVPPGGLYRPAVPPGGYPLEPFGYYPSQLPYRPVSNSQAGPRPLPNPNSYQPKNGDTYYPQMPDSYVPSHPMIPLRPGFYPGPVPYDGYYGPPRMSLCNPNDRDAASMGLAAFPFVCNPNQNVHPDSINFNIRPGGYGPSSVMAKEQMESTHSRDPCQGPYKLLLKQHDSLGGNDAEETREPSVKPITQNEWIADCRKGEPTDFSKQGVEGSHPELTGDQRELSSVPVGKLPENNIKGNTVDDGLVKKPETVADVAQGPQHHPIIKKSPTLIDKIEGLNTKTRISEGWCESRPVSAKEVNVKQFKVRNAKADHSTNESVSVFCNEDASSGSMVIQEVVDFRGDKSLESTKRGKVVSRQVEHQATSVSTLNSLESREKAHSETQKRLHDMQGRTDVGGRERFNIEVDEWKKKPLAVNSSVNATTNADGCCDAHVQDHHSYQEAPEKQEMNHAGKVGGGLYTSSSFDSTDYQAQRAKMKEIAAQRAKQLQKEEEERTREQKAKALAKLEELNRRTLAENAAQKSESSLLQHVESHNIIPQTNTTVPDEVTGVSCSDSDAVTKTEQSMSKPKEALNHSPQGLVSDVNISVVPLNQEANATDSVAEQISSQVHDNSLFKQKQMGNKRRQHNSHEKNLGDKTIAAGGRIVHGNVIVNPSASSVDSGLGNNNSSNDNLPLQLKKNKSTKNKQKTDEASIPVPSPSSAPLPIEGNTVKASDESVKPKAMEPVPSEVTSVQPQSGREIVESQNSQDLESADKGLVQPTDEPNGKINNKLKPQHPRRMSRSTQAFRPAEKFHGTEASVWAPVRFPPNRNESSGVANQNNTTDGGHSLGNNGSGTQNSLKGKRADIERYVPKPVAKELSQQNSQNPRTPSVQATSEEVMGKADYGSEGSKSRGQMDNIAVEKTVFAGENKNGNSNHNKLGRTHASWRQRGSAEPSVALQSSHEESVAVPVVVMDHGVAGKGRRHLTKAQRVTGHSYFPRNNSNLGGGVTHKAGSSTLALDSSEADGNSLKIENQCDGEHMSSHWQPKSQALSTHSREKRAGGGGQNATAQVGRTSEKLSLLQTTHVQLQAEKNDNDQIQLQPNQSKAQNYVVPLVNKNERKGVDTFKERAKIPYRGPPCIAELAPENVDTHQEQQMVYSGQRRQGPHNGRFDKQQESSYGGVHGDSQGQDVNKQRIPTIGDRRKHNSHYEYQPVGSYNKPSNSFRHNSNVDAAPRDGARAGLRYQEKGQNHSRHGGHYGRNGGSTAQVTTSGLGE